MEVRTRYFVEEKFHYSVLSVYGGPAIYQG